MHDDLLSISHHERFVAYESYDTDKTTCGKEGIVPTQEYNSVLLEGLPQS